MQALPASTEYLCIVEMGGFVYPLCPHCLTDHCFPCRTASPHSACRPCQPPRGPVYPSILLMDHCFPCRTASPHSACRPCQPPRGPVYPSILLMDHCFPCRTASPHSACRPCQPPLRPCVSFNSSHGPLLPLQDCLSPLSMQALPASPRPCVSFYSSHGPLLPLQDCLSPLSMQALPASTEALCILQFFSWTIASLARLPLPTQHAGPASLPRGPVYPSILLMDHCFPCRTASPHSACRPCQPPRGPVYPSILLMDHCFPCRTASPHSACMPCQPPLRPCVSFNSSHGPLLPLQDCLSPLSMQALPASPVALCILLFLSWTIASLAGLPLPTQHAGPASLP